jgi:hypothetical protein
LKVPFIVWSVEVTVMEDGLPGVLVIKPAFTMLTGV